MPFYAVKHFRNGEWIKTTCLNGDSRPHAIRVALDWHEDLRGCDGWTVYRNASTINATHFKRDERNPNRIVSTGFAPETRKPRQEGIFQ